MSSAYYTDLGTIDYTDMLKIQRELVDMRHTDQIKDMILFAEHHPAILFGHERENNAFSDLFVKDLHGRSPLDLLVDMGIGFHETKQIEKAATVGPGQLFICPINDYTRLFKPYETTKYNVMLDRAMQKMIRKFGIDGKVVEDKIKFENTIIGSKKFHMTHKVASHGFHINVNAPATEHNWIINTKDVHISMEHLADRIIDTNCVKKAALSSLKKNFGYRRLEECKVQLNGGKVSIRKS